MKMLWPILMSSLPAYAAGIQENPGKTHSGLILNDFLLIVSQTHYHCADLSVTMWLFDRLFNDTAPLSQVV
jgi:hypothetical protein